MRQIKGTMIMPAANNLKANKMAANHRSEEDSLSIRFVKNGGDSLRIAEFKTQFPGFARAVWLGNPGFSEIIQRIAVFMVKLTSQCRFQT